MSNIFVLTRDIELYNQLCAVLSVTKHELTRLEYSNDLPEVDSVPINLVILDVDFSIVWTTTLRELTELRGLKVVVVSTRPTSKEAVAALAEMQGGTALDYSYMDAPDEELVETIQSALAYDPKGK